MRHAAQTQDPHPPRGAQWQGERPAVVRAAHRPADGDPRHHGREHRAPEPRRRPRPERLQHQLDDHQLLGHLRKPAALRWPRGRSAGATADVPHRSRHLHGLVVRLGHGGDGRRPFRRPGRPGSWRGDALSRGPRDHHDRLPGTPAGEGARRLGSSRRRRRRDRRPRRRPPHRVHRLADDLLRQPPRRSGARRRRVEGRPRRHRRSRAGRDSTSAAPCSRPRASARSSSRSPRREALAGAPPRRSWSAWAACRTRCLRSLRAPHRDPAPARRAAGRSRRRRRALPDARRGRLDLRPLPAQLALPPERARHGPARYRPRLHPARTRGRNRRPRGRPHRRPPRRSRPARRQPSWSRRPA